LDDIVVATVGDQSYYYKCITEGSSGTTEPAWTNISGSTVVDGSVDWYAYKTVEWKEKGASCEFIKFGLVGDPALSPTPDPTPATEVGVVTTGTWQATPIAVAYGGTGAVNAKSARANLGAVTKYATNIGDGASTTIVVVHNLGTKDVITSVAETILPAGVIDVDVAIIDNNTITLTFADAPTIGQYRVTIIG
jgi:hypothetical protein